MEFDFTFKLKRKLLGFLDHQKESSVSGYNRYSYSGDFFTNKQRSNLAGSIFALKIYRMLGVQNENTIKPIVDRILSFKQTDGTFRDPFICRKRFFRNILSNLKKGQFTQLNNQQYIRAETRQAYSALMLYEIFPERISFHIPTSPNDVEKFLRSLDWTHPWGAGSHFSHLMFFLSLMKKIRQIDGLTFHEVRRTAVEFITALQHENNGTWYEGNPSHRQKVNGAMKVITGLIVDGLSFKYPERLIDLCLLESPQSTADACDQINQILVLRYANQLCDRNYRREEIQNYCFKTLEIWKEYYYPELGGFSFYKHRANDRYYGAKISLGLDEPDIHGTVLFVWGFSMLNQILQIPELQFLREIKT